MTFDDASQHIGLALFLKSVFENDAKNVKNLIQKELGNARLRIFLNVKNRLGLTPLHCAVVLGNLEVVKELLRSTSLQVNAQDDESGWTALHKAFYHGHLRIASSLLSRKDINLKLKDRNGQTALDLLEWRLSNIRPIADDFGVEDASTIVQWGMPSTQEINRSICPIPSIVNLPESGLTVGSSQIVRQRPIIRQVVAGPNAYTIMTDRHIYTEEKESIISKGVRQFEIDDSRYPKNVAHIAFGSHHTIILDQKGSVFTYGNNSYGQTGHEQPANLITSSSLRSDTGFAGKRVHYGTPMRLLARAVGNFSYTGASASRYHSVIYSDLRLVTFGLDMGQIGLYSSLPEKDRARTLAVRPPSAQPQVEQDGIMEVSTNDIATTVLTKAYDVVVIENWTLRRVTLPVNSTRNDFMSGNNFSFNARIPHDRPIKVRSGHRAISGSTPSTSEWYYPNIAVTANGNVFIWMNKRFSKGHPRASIEAKKVWAARDEAQRVIDADIAADGNLVLCTIKGRAYGTSWREARGIDGILLRVKATFADRTNSTGGLSTIRARLFKFIPIDRIRHVKQVKASAREAKFLAVCKETVLRPAQEPSNCSLLDTLARFCSVDDGAQSIVSITASGAEGKATVVLPSRLMCLRSHSFACLLQEMDNEAPRRHEKRFSFGEESTDLLSAIMADPLAHLQSRMKKIKTDGRAQIDLLDADEAVVRSLVSFYRTGIYELQSSDKSAENMRRLTWQSKVVSCLFGHKGLSTQLDLLPPVYMKSFQSSIVAKRRTHFRRFYESGSAYVDCSLITSTGVVECHSAVLMSQSDFIHAALSDTWHCRILQGRRAGKDLINVNVKEVDQNIAQIVVMWCYGFDLEAVLQKWAPSDIFREPMSFSAYVVKVMAAASYLAMSDLSEACSNLVKCFAETFSSLSMGLSAPSDSSLRKVCLRLMLDHLALYYENSVPLACNMEQELEEMLIDMLGSSPYWTDRKEEQRHDWIMDLDIDSDVLRMSLTHPSTSHEPATPSGGHKFESLISHGSFSNSSFDRSGFLATAVSDLSLDAAADDILQASHSSDLESEPTTPGHVDDALVFDLEDAQSSAVEGVWTPVKKGKQRRQQSLDEGSALSSPRSDQKPEVRDHHAPASSSQGVFHTPPPNRRSLEQSALVPLRYASPPGPSRPMPFVPIRQPTTSSSKGHPPTSPGDQPAEEGWEKQFASSMEFVITIKEKSKQKGKKNAKRNSQSDEKAPAWKPIPELPREMQPDNQNYSYPSLGSVSPTGRNPRPQSMTEPVRESYGRRAAKGVKTNKIGTIQIQQLAETRRNETARKKTMQSLQAEDRAIEELLSFYQATSARHSGEIFSIERLQSSD